MAKISIKKFKIAIVDSGGNQSLVAERLNCNRSSVCRFLQKNPPMKDLLEEEAEKVIDVAENIVDHQIVKDKDLDTAKWKLLHSKRGKARGYGIKQEMEHDVKAPLTAQDLGEAWRARKNEQASQGNN
jgi:hypothetical protein